MNVRHAQSLIPPALTLLLAALLLRFPPEQYSFYPRCPIYAWTRLLCPGCGATRALAALLQGHFLVAIQQNALIVGLTPFVLGYMAIYSTHGLRSDSHRLPRPPRWAFPAALAITTLFTLARNFSKLHS